MNNSNIFPNNNNNNGTFYVNPLPALTVKSTLGLNQIENFQPVQSFVDATNTPWQLVKAASNSSIDIPDPKSMQIIDSWAHEFPGLKSEVYVYVVEGIKQPRVETEQPTRILYQWFSKARVPNFVPAMITDREWLKANVYAAPVINDRLSKLQAICHIENINPISEQVDENQLIKVEEFPSGRTERNTKTSKGRNQNTSAIIPESKVVGNTNVLNKESE